MNKKESCAEQSINGHPPYAGARHLCRPLVVIKKKKQNTINMKKVLFLAIILIAPILIFGQSIIKMEKEGGVFKIPCKINGKDVKFIFDSGASDVSVSLEYFLEGIKNGVFKETDILPEIVNYKIANGDISQAQRINIRNLKIGNLTLYNVKASVSLDLNSPMLLGQSAMEQFGEYTISYDNSTLKIRGNAQSDLDIAFKKAKEKLQNQVNATGNSDMLSMYEIQIQQSKEEMENDLKVVEGLEFEVYEVAKRESGGNNSVTFKYDITNNSNYNYSFKALSQITINLEVITEDGKTYTTSIMLGQQQAMKRSNTVNGIDLTLKLRNRVPKFYRLYGTVSGPLLSQIRQ